MWTGSLPVRGVMPPSGVEARADDTPSAEYAVGNATACSTTRTNCLRCELAGAPVFANSAVEDGLASSIPSARDSLPRSMSSNPQNMTDLEGGESCDPPPITQQA